MTAPSGIDPVAAETELRLAGERALMDATGPARGLASGGALGSIASALVQLGLLDRGVVGQLLDDYGLALSVRGVGAPPHFRHLRARHRAASSPAPLPLPVLHLVDRVLDLPQDPPHVTQVLLSPDSAALHVTYRRSPSFLGGLGRSRTRSAPYTPPQWSVRDDMGATAIAHFSGGGGGDHWQGSWTTDQPLAQGAAWLEIDGVRLEFGTPVPSSDVRLLPVEAGPSPAIDLLVQRLSDGTQQWDGPDPAVEVLARLGLLTEADAPALEAVQELSIWPHRRSRLSPAAQAALPERWRGWYDQRAPKGPTGRVPLLATTPEFDGVQARVHSLVSDRDGFSVEVLTHGFTVDPHPDGQVLTAVSLTWWASDELGTWYVGQLEPQQSDATTTTGVVRFSPPLHPQATTLRMEARTLRTAAVVDVALPTWRRR